jgi:hypothetical protein
MNDINKIMYFIINIKKCVMTYVKVVMSGIINDINYQHKYSHTIIALQFAHLIVFNICVTFTHVSDYNAL